MKISKLMSSALVLGLVIAGSLALSSCGESAQAEKGSKANPVIIGVVGESDSHWSKFKQAAEKEGIYIEYRDFSEYSQVNPAVAQNQIDLNEYQHILYLAKYDVDNNQDLVPFAATAVFPISLFGAPDKNVKSIEDLKQGDKVAIPSDGTNQSRAILLLEAAGLVKLKPGHGVIVNPAQIDESASKVVVYPVQADLTANSLTDPQIRAAIVNNDYVKNLPTEAQKNSIYSEPGESEGAKPYINIWVSRHGEEDTPVFVKLANIFDEDEATQAALAKDSGGPDKLVIVGNKISKDELTKILEEQANAYLSSK